jgi:hypothetical protein
VGDLLIYAGALVLLHRTTLSGYGGTAADARGRA